MACPNHLGTSNPNFQIDKPVPTEPETKMQNGPEIMLVGVIFCGGKSRAEYPNCGSIALILKLPFNIFCWTLQFYKNSCCNLTKKKQSPCQQGGDPTFFQNLLNRSSQFGNFQKNLLVAAPPPPTFKMLTWALVNIIILQNIYDPIFFILEINFSACLKCY